jgi:(p)ppGpp synthase/HD superfamily hydrolase
MTELTSRFDAALVYAAHVHAGQRRKGTAIPYLSHLLAVTALVLEDGGSEDEAIAALLHDAPEDRGGLERLEDIRARFGGRVARIVEELSDTFADPKPPWKPRKQAYIERLPRSPTEALRVSLADKLHNARAVLRDYRSSGDGVWKRFTGGRCTVPYYAALAETFARTGVAESRLCGELEEVVAQLRAETGIEERFADCCPPGAKDAEA